VEALGMGGPGGLEGTVSDRVSVLHYSERRVLRPCVAAKNKPVGGTWVEALDMGGLGGPKRTIFLLVRWGVTAQIKIVVKP
jgi:hypothetical protein